MESDEDFASAASAPPGMLPLPSARPFIRCAAEQVK